MTLNELQQKFNEIKTKKWRMLVSHEPAQLVGFYLRHDAPMIFARAPGGDHLLHAESLSTHRDCPPLIEEVSPFEGWPMDAKIRVWNLPGDAKEARYFAGENDEGLPLAWVNGCTSHTTNITAVWRHAELVEGAK